MSRAVKDSGGPGGKRPKPDLLESPAAVPGGFDWDDEGFCF